MNKNTEKKNDCKNNQRCRLSPRIIDGGVMCLKKIKKPSNRKKLKDYLNVEQY